MDGQLDRASCPPLDERWGFVGFAVDEDAISCLDAILFVEHSSFSENMACIYSKSSDLTLRDCEFVAGDVGEVVHVQSGTAVIERCSVVGAMGGGADGLEFYRRIIPSLSGAVRSCGIVAFEIGDTLGAAVAQMMSAASFDNIEIRTDDGGLERVVTAVRP